MKAVVVEAPGSVAVRDRPDPVPGIGALVRMLGAGICGTDVKIVSGGLPARLPVILGHEAVGRVEVPAPGSDIPAGSRVVVDPAASCGECEVCRDDLPHLCPRGGLMGRDFDGALAELVAVPERRLHVIPDEVGFADAMLLQVLSTCMHAQSRLRHQFGKSAVVIGLGATGLLHVMLLSAAGVAPVVGISRSPARRSLASELGATAAGTPAQAPELVAELTGGRGADIAIECAGTQETLAQAMRLAGFGGTVLVFGTMTSADGVPLYDQYLKELTLVGSRAARPRDMSAAIRAVSGGRLRPGRLITASYPLADAAAAVAATGKPDQVKVTITIAGGSGT